MLDYMPLLVHAFCRDDKCDGNVDYVPLLFHTFCTADNCDENVDYSCLKYLVIS